MAADDTRLIAQLVVGRRVHCVGDESVMALAKRVLELEAECAAKHAIAAEEAARRARVEADLAEERELARRTHLPSRRAPEATVSVRARGGQPSTIVGVSEGNDG